MVVFHRNFDYPLDKFEEGEIYKPKDIFIDSKAVITYLGDMIFRFTWPYGDFEHSAELDLESIGLNFWSPLDKKGRSQKRWSQYTLDRISKRYISWMARSDDVLGRFGSTS